MNRHIAAWATVAIAVLGVTACSSAPAAPESTAAQTSAPAVQTTPAEQTTPAAPESSASGQTLAEACLEPNAKLVEASAELAKVNAALAASDGKDVQAMADALTAMGDYFGSLAESSSNTEVEEALTGIATGYRTMGELYPKAVGDQDLTAMTELTTVMTDLQKSMDAFSKLCGA